MAPQVVGIPGQVSPQPIYISQARTNGLAIASLVLGLVPVVPLVGSILAIIFGIIAEKQINRSGGTERGVGLAVAGTVLGIIGVFGVLILYFWLLPPQF